MGAFLVHSQMQASSCASALFMTGAPTDTAKQLRLCAVCACLATVHDKRFAALGCLGCPIAAAVPNRGVAAAACAYHMCIQG
eukprot:1161593-Pelagomonas_calceolata.AAC.9